MAQYTAQQAAQYGATHVQPNGTTFVPTTAAYGAKPAGQVYTAVGTVTPAAGAALQVQVTAVVGPTPLTTQATVAVFTPSGWVRVGVWAMGVWEGMTVLDDMYDMEEMSDLDSLACWCTYVACGAYALCAAMVANVAVTGI